MVLNYGVQFMAAHTNQPYFGLMWLHSATNVNMNALRLLDQPLAAALRDMHTKKLLERTVVVVVAGRGSGNANPGFKATAQGEAETKNPFAYIYLPKTFRDTYPSVFEAVKINANRLVTPFDLHNTLLSLADPDQYLSHYSVAANLVDGGKPKVQSDASNNGRKLEFSAPNTDETKPNVVNLFDPITLTRTCLEAGIQPSFCMCVRRPGLPTTDHHVIDMAQRMVKILNDYLFYHDECYGLKLKEVLYAEKLPKAPTPKTYFLKFSTLPKPMVFEGIFEFFFRKTNQPQQYSVNITNVITTPMVRKTNCVQLLLEKKNFQQILFGERHWKPQD
ncbi:hypothetical protein B566_EDAN017675 [Ephemera danica]|nr:hypothetical protein B566_EDAN017675 [Ephemera danica]